MAIDLKIPNKVEFLQKEFFLLKYTEITKIMLHSEWCPSDQKFPRWFFNAKKHSHVAPVHANVQMEAPTAPRGFDFGPLYFGSSPTSSSHH